MSLFSEIVSTFIPELSARSGEKLNRVLRNIAEGYSPYAVTSAYSFSSEDSIDSLQVNATSAAITITLPSPTGNRRRRVIKTDVSANAVTVSAGSYLINGAGTVVLAAQYDFVWVEPTGTGWLIIGQ